MPNWTDPSFWGLISWILIPIGIILTDIFPAVMASRSRVHDIDDDTPHIDDYEILVPIYGNVKYLENVEYLSQYGSRVVLCTTTEEDDEFNDAIREIVDANGFRLFMTHVPGRKTEPGKKAVAAPIRDKVIADALATVEATYVVCIDADTTTNQSLDLLVGALSVSGMDVASVRLLPSNRVNLITRLQWHEYYMAMRMRRLYPWLVSGACHVAKTTVHHEVMSHHTLFFQGNDVEFGILADAMGYDVGHIPFDVPTTVPASFHPWFRQRYAWVGGEFRVYVANIRFARNQPFFYFYGVVVLFLATPLRVYSMFSLGYSFVFVLVAYLLSLLIFNRRNIDLTLLILPFYMMIGTMFLVPIGMYSYISMAVKHGNWGIMRPGKSRLVARSPYGMSWSGAPVYVASVRQLQNDLIAVGHDPGRADGDFGYRTLEALTAWQRELLDLGYDLGPTGADGVYGSHSATASQAEVPWRGLLDDSLPTTEWIESYQEPQHFLRPA